jgi:hypothetical protein
MRVTGFFLAAALSSLPAPLRAQGTDLIEEEREKA